MQAQRSRNGAWGADLAEGLELLGDEEARALDVVALAHHRGVSAVRGAEPAEGRV